VNAHRSSRRHSPELPRSLHRPVAPTEGCLTSNLNKTGVRLWTDPSAGMGDICTSDPMAPGQRGQFWRASSCQAPDYIEMDDVTAKAARFALRERSAHQECLDRCSGWSSHEQLGSLWRSLGRTPEADSQSDSQSPGRGRITRHGAEAESSDFLSKMTGRHPADTAQSNS
jgi:hypothetical protein